MIPKPLASAIVVIVTLAWSVNFGAQFVVPDYKPDQLVHAAFMAIVGGALALSRGDGKKPPGRHRSQDEDDDS